MSLRRIDQFIRWNPQYRRYEPVYWRREVLPSWLTFTEVDLTLPYVVPATGTPGPQATMKQPYASVEGLDRDFGTPFEVRNLVFQDSTDGTPAANFTVQMQEVGETRTFMNNPIHVRTIAGTGQNPGLLREPYMFLSQHNIRVQLNKISGAGTTARLYLGGAQYFPWSPEFMRFREDRKDIMSLLAKWRERRKYVTPFWMTTDVSPVVLTGAPAAGSTVEAFIKIGDDSQIEIFGHSAVRTGNFLLEIMDVKTKQTLMNGAITGTNGVGSNIQFPTLYPTPFLVPAGSRMRLRFTDLTGAPNTIFFTFFARRIYAPFSQVMEVLHDTAVPTPADTPTPEIPRPV